MKTVRLTNEKKKHVNMLTSWRNSRKSITTGNKLIKLAKCLLIQRVSKHVDAIDQKLSV